MGPWYRVDIPCPTDYEDTSCALSPGLKATAQLLELVLGWQGERNPWQVRRSRCVECGWGGIEGSEFFALLSLR